MLLTTRRGRAEQTISRPTTAHRRSSWPGHAYRPGHARRRRPAGLPSQVVRVGSVVMFGRLVGATGLGAYVGAALAGLIAVVTGQAFSSCSTWLSGVPVLAALGAAVGPGIAWFTRRWFLPRLRRRVLAFTAADVLVLPLAVAIGQLRAIGTLGLLLVFLGGATTVTLYLRAATGRTRRPRVKPGTR